MSNQELLNRKHLAVQSAAFGIDYLDCVLNGIRPCDLIIIAARTGAGKTELSSLIAMHNAAKNRRVVLFALEAEKFEIHRRLKYQMLAKYFFSHRLEFSESIRLNYTDWLFDKYGTAFDSLEEKLEEDLVRALENLEIYSPQAVDFTKKDFSIVYNDACEQGADLIILDHIHYLAPNEKEHENEHIKKTMWGLRDSVNQKEVPIVAFSHLRKQTKYDTAVVPSLEEIHGSSEISKQANHVISFSPAFCLPSKDDPKSELEAPIGSTLCRVLKTRSGHTGASRYVSLLNFNVKQNKYDPGFVPYLINQHGDKLTPMKYQDFEPWMEGPGREPKI